jgi:hypothetical protein
MFVGVLSLTYHSLITIGFIGYGTNADAYRLVAISLQRTIESVVTRGTHLYTSTREGNSHGVFSSDFAW